MKSLIVFLRLLGHFSITHAGEKNSAFEILINTHHDACLDNESECPRSAPRFPREAGNSPEEILSQPQGEPELKSVPKLCCGYCICSLDCHKYGSCCLSMYENLEHGRTSIENTRYDCVSPEYLTTKRTKSVISVWMVTKCLPDWRNNTVRNLCENPGEDGTFNSMVPVTTKYPYTHYRNKFCALCNGFDNSLHMSTWTLEINCQRILTIPDKNLLSSLEDKQCNIVYKPPENIPVQECRKIPFSISRCNVTGKWKYYDEIIERGCLSFIDPFNLTYMNYFCYLCNTAETALSNPLICTTHIDNIEDVIPPFSAIMNLDVINSMVQDTNLDCNMKTQFKDTKLKICRDVFCYDGRYLVKDECMIDPTYPDRHCYHLFIKLTPRDFESTLFVDLVKDSSFHLTILGRFSEAIQSFNEEVVRFELFYKRNILSPMNTVDSLLVQITLISLVEETNSDILNDFVHKIHNRIISISVRNAYRELYAELVVQNMTTNGNKISSGATATTSDALVNIYNTPVNARHSNTCLNTETITLRHLHLCPYIKIRFNEIAMKIENNVLHMKEPNLENISFSQWEYEMDDENVFICKKDYMSFYEMLPNYKVQKALVVNQIDPKHILALACVCLSICCLLITIATYIFLYNIQSQPGINNIILCVFLVMAQLLFQFGAGQSSLSKWACTLIGALCHFLWLSVMFSMNICCIQMFLIFRSPAKSSPELDFKVTLKYLLYVIILALVFVTINLILSLQDSGGSETGYGGTICFISSSLLHLVTFIIPSAVAISANIILFAYVVFSISQTNANSVQLNQDRNYFGAYARLSSLTGLTWILGYLYIFMKNETLEYMFIICNASQGVFIMIAFVLNKRTYKMLCKGKCSNRMPLQNTKDLPDNGELNMSATKE